MRLQAVLDRLEEEIDAGTEAIHLVEQQFDLEHERRNLLLSLDTQCEQAVGRLLLKGDHGLSEAVICLRLLRDGLMSLAEQERQSRAAQELHRRVRRLHDHVHGESRWIFDTRRLRPILVRRPRVAAVAARSLLLLALLYQFFWDAVTQNIIFWPLSLPLVQNFFGRFSAFGTALFTLLALIVGAVAVIFVGVPVIALRTAFLAHRRNLAAHVTAQINQAIRERICADLESRADEMGYQHDRLLKLQQTLRAGAAGSQSSAALAGDMGTYLETAVVHPIDVARPYCDQVVRSILERSPRGLVDSWLYNPQEPNWETKTDAEILDQLRQRIAPVVRQMVFKPIEGYLASGDTEQWLYHLWRASTPWVKLIGLASSVRHAEPLEINVVIAPPDAGDSLRRAAQTYGSYTEALVWPERYRIYMLRLLAGITGSALAHRASLQQAFQLQPTSVQATIIADATIRAQYRALMPKPEVARQTEPVPSVELDLQPEIASQPVETPFEPTVTPVTTSERSPIDRPAPLRPLQNVIKEFEQGIKGLEKSVADGFIMGLEPVRTLIHPPVPDEPVIVRMLLDSLSELEQGRSVNDLAVREHLSGAFEQLEQLLSDLDVGYIDPTAGTLFDPRYADPVDQLFDDAVPADHVLKVTRRGYRDRISGQVLLPAMVIVSRGLVPPPSEG